MAKFTVTVSRNLKQTTTIEVDAKDKRTAALTAGAKFPTAEWKDAGDGDVKISAIEKVETAPLRAAAASTGRGGRRRAA